MYIEVSFSNWQNILMTVQWKLVNTHTKRTCHSVHYYLGDCIEWAGLKKKMSGTHVLYFDEETLFYFLSITFTSSSLRTHNHFQTKTTFPTMYKYFSWNYTTMESCIHDLINFVFATQPGGLNIRQTIKKVIYR